MDLVLDRGGEEQEVAAGYLRGPRATAHRAAAAQEVVDLLDVLVDVPLVRAACRDAVVQHELERTLEGRAPGLEDTPHEQVAARGRRLDIGVWGHDEPRFGG